MKLSYLKAVIFLSIVHYALPAADSSCNSRWQGYSKCMRMQLGKNKDPRTGLPVPNNSASLNFQISNIRNCFKDNNCKDPLAPEASSRARGLCFPSALYGLRQELQKCMQKNLTNFQLPDDEYSAASGVNEVLLLLSINAMQNVGKFCPSNVKPDTITTCVSKKWSSSMTTPAPTSLSYCDTVSQCKSQSLMTEKCHLGWNELMCPCAQSMRFLGTVTKYENQYIDCMKKIGVTVDKTNDPALTWLDSSVKGWCDSTSNIRGTSSWAPGNRYCELVATTKPTTRTTTTTTTTTTSEYEETEATSEDTTTTEAITDWNTEATEYTDFSGDTTQRTWFFDQFTFETQGEPVPTTTPVPVVTPKPGFFENMGMQNPVQSWIDFFKGKRR